MANTPVDFVTPAGLATRERQLTVTPIKNAAYTAAPADLVRADITAGSFTVTLPAASSKWRVVVKAVAGPAGSSAAFATTACNVAAAGTDVINTGATSVPIRSGRSKTFISDGAGVITVSSGDTDATVEQAAADLRYVTAKPGLYIPAGWSDNWKAKRAAAAAGTGLARVALVGDSITQLFAASSFANSWAGKTRTALQTLAGDGGSGFVGVKDSFAYCSFATGYSGITWPCTFTGSGWTFNPASSATVGTGPGTVARATSTSGDSVTFTGRGRRITLWMPRLTTASTVVTVAIDGTTVDTFSAAGAVANLTKTYDAVTTGTHTVTVTNGDTNPMTVWGVDFRNDTGVVVDNYARQGAYSSVFSSGDQLVSSQQVLDVNGGSLKPADLTVLALGVNDNHNAVTSVAFGQNLRFMLGRLRDNANGTTLLDGTGDLLIVMNHIGAYEPTTGGARGQLYGDYCAYARAAAETFGAGFVDLWTMGRNSYKAWSNLGFWGTTSGTPGAVGTDGIHLDDAGHNFACNQIAPLLTA